MPRARRQIVSLEATPFYHCISRCVRRAFLCGKDRLSGRSFEHRRQWIVDRMGLLASVFTIDVCAYAVMSNHYHVVLRCNPEAAESLSEGALVKRLQLLWEIPGFVKRHLRGTYESKKAAAWLAERRQRLSSISWYMACLNEWVARKANQEDGCTGRFWEGRFRSQALMSEKALITCMAYVDLNPIRAGMAKGLLDSDYTAIQARLRREGTVPLVPFNPADPSALPMTLEDYVELVEWTGQAALPGKSGQLTENVSSSLGVIGHDEISWRLGMRLFGTRLYAVVGSLDQARQFAARIGKRWSHGDRECAQAFD